MSLLLNHPCRHKEDYDEYVSFLNKCSKERNRESSHSNPPEGTDWPGLVITLVDTTTEPGRKDFFSHTLISRDRLLKALGMSQAEIKMEAFGISDEKIPDDIEQREI